MDKMQTPMAKILVHSDGLGVPNPDLVRKRAQELAAIAGRKEYTDIDWQQARVELHGAHASDGAISNEMAMEAMVSEADMLAVDVGHQRERTQLDDERNLVEELWTEGMEEAEHERMLASRAEEREEGEEEEV
jgi:hypothetical protein